MQLSETEVARWEVEIQQCEKFREENFGSYNRDKVEGSGKNLNYYELGIDVSGVEGLTTLNVIFPIIKNVIPSLYFQNPKILSFPKRNEDQDSSPLAAEILNYYHRENNIKEVNQMVVFDAYVLGMGVCKIGYATKFGADIEDEEIRKEREKKKKLTLINTVKGMFGLKPKEVEEPKQNIELNEFIRTEAPYVVHVSPFDFGIDPRANSIYDATYIYHKLRKTLKSVKSNPNYKNTKDLQASVPEGIDTSRLSQSEIENFQVIDLYEIHYKTDEGINILTIAKDQSEYKAIYHEESIYDMDGFQFEVLTFNKHAHKLYPKSDISHIRGLQDRTNLSLDTILDQVDRFVSKIFYDGTAITDAGKVALENGGLGALVECNKTPGEVAKEFSMIQVKADMIALVDRLIDIMSLITGLTRAQLTGLSNVETATGEQIGQSGANLRRSDQSQAVKDFVNRQSTKLWQVIAQFVDLEELQLITGEGMLNTQGQVQYNWLKIDEPMREKLIKGHYSFDIEIGSERQPSIEVMRQQVTNIINQLFNPVVKRALTAEGTTLRLTEVLRAGLKLFPEVFKNVEKIIQQATPQQQQMAQQQMMQPSNRGNSMENTGAIPNMQRRPPTPTTMQEEIYGESRGGAG
jgi:hypothetical protein